MIEFDGDRLGTLAVDDARDLAGVTETANGAGASRSATIGGQSDFRHGELRAGFLFG